jgi:hypothetical protein
MGFTAAPSHQTIEASKISAPCAPCKVIRRLENGEFLCALCDKSRHPQ